MKVFVDAIPRLKNKQVANTIIDIIQAFKSQRPDFKTSVVFFGLVVDILCSEGVLQLNESQRRNICFETMQRLPQKMHMETPLVELALLLQTIVSDVVLGDVYHENDSMQDILGLGEKSVTFSRHIDMGELMRQLYQLESVLLSKKLADEHAVRTILKNISHRAFLILHRVNNVACNNRDKKRIIGKHTAVYTECTIMELIAVEISNIATSTSLSNEYCLLWIGIRDLYSKQYQLMPLATGSHDYVHSARKMVLAKEDMAQHLRIHGAIDTQQMIKTIAVLVIQLRPSITDFVKIEEQSSSMRGLRLILPNFANSEMLPRIQTAVNASRGIHLLHGTKCVASAESNDMALGAVVPQSVCAIVQTMSDLFESTIDVEDGPGLLKMWLRKNVVVSFLHLVWSIYTT